MLPPAPPAPSPPSHLQQARRTGLSERQRSARTRTRSHAEVANLGLTPQDCTVGTALAFCGCATNEVDRDASMLQAHNVHTHAHTHSHIHTHTHTHTHAHTNAQAHTLTQAHTRTHTLTHAHTLAIAPKQHAKLAHTCSSSSSSEATTARVASSFERGWLLNITVK
jgi:hypothetical protein